tara:strand:- start:775 stop:1458 length:684 start_codon:yes stop_codon:yes gene_type:complete
VNDVIGFIAGVDPQLKKKQRQQLKALAAERHIDFVDEPVSHNVLHYEARTELQYAITAAETSTSVFAVASVSGFTNRKWIGLQLLEQIAERGVSIEVADDPSINSHSISVLAHSAEVAKEKLLTRSRKALQSIKTRLAAGEEVYSSKGRKILKLGTPQASEAMARARISKANDFAAEIFPMIKPYLDRGLSLNRIAQELNRQGVKTAKGTKFYQSTISGIVRRIKNE